MGIETLSSSKWTRGYVPKAQKSLYACTDTPFLVSRTLGGSAERLYSSCSSPAVQETASSVYHVVEGSGYTEIDGHKVLWKKGDTFCIPTWNKYQHFADGRETVYLYRVDDKPQLNSLGFYRKAGADPESYVNVY
jgi:gentisate 1,2-dioxygenase